MTCDQIPPILNNLYVPLLMRHLIIFIIDLLFLLNLSSELFESQINAILCSNFVRAVVCLVGHHMLVHLSGVVGYGEFKMSKPA